MNALEKIWDKPEKTGEQDPFLLISKRRVQRAICTVDPSWWAPVCISSELNLATLWCKFKDKRKP